jgi:Mg-chelatase subunit ChlD
MITLALPWALVLLIPAAAAWWAWARGGPGALWRAAVLVLLVVAASRPQLTRDDGGSDVILVIDRSASMGEARRGQEELTRLVGDGRTRGDRLAVIAVGAEARVAQGPQATGVPRLDDLQVDAQGSDLDGGLEAAATLIAPGRSVRVLLASDGEATGLDPRRSAARLALLGAPVDVLPERRVGAADAAIADLDLPGGLRRGESFLGAIELISDRTENRAWKVLRGETVIAGGTATLRPDRPLTVAFSDRPAQPGLVAYSIVLDDRDDRQPANNTARAWVRVEAGERVLVVGGDGTRGNIANALAGAGLEVVTRSAGPLRLADLLGCQAVVLAEVPAGAIGHAGMAVLARWVREMGGGLVMTGGRQSFGSGGWQRSPVEPILPVSLEVRDEHRVLSVAMAIAIDRSGSMSVQIPDGRQKIQLAAEGAAAAIELLGPRDRIAVMAVDTAPHEILPMSKVDDPKAMAREVLGMESAGGGIYIYEALAAAGKELLRTDAGTRHLLLFADASDSEEPGDYVNLLAEYRKHGITVSVVGMGEETDCHASLLVDVAKRGGGRIAFAADPADLPRLFAQETVLVARNPWVDQAISPTPADLRIFGGNAESLRAAWPAIPGYNLTYPRPGALIHAWCPGDPKAPAAASWNIGVGRAAALPIPCDAADAAALVAWPGYAPLLASLTRWAAGNEAQAIGVVSARRRGGMAEIRLELDPSRQAEWPVAPPELLLVGDESAPSRPLPLTPLDAGVWTAQVRLADRPVVPAVALGGAAVLGPALALPMPAEVAPRRDLPDGGVLLEDITRTTGGRMRGDVLGIWDNPASTGVTRELAPWLVIAALVAAVLEIAFRRLRLQPRLALPRLPRRAAAASTTPAVPRPAAAEITATPETAAPQTTPPPATATGQSTVLDAFDQVRRRR